MSKKKSWFARVKDFLFPLKDDTKEQLKNKKKKKKKKRPIGMKRTTKNPYSSETTSLSRDRTEINAKTQLAHQTLPALVPSSSEETGASTTTTSCSVSLPTSSSSTRHCEEYSALKILLRRAQLIQHVEQLAAIKIQTSFRGYLARKALRALKALVRLQAMIRGRAVRRQAVAMLKSLQSIVNIQSQVCATRYQKANEYKRVEDPRDVKLKVAQSIQRRSDHTLLMKNQDNAILLSKTEAMMRRSRLKAYSFSHRHSADTEDVRMVGRLRQWLEDREENEVPMKEEIKRVDTIRLRNKQPIMLAPRSSFESNKLRSTSHLRDKLAAKPTYMAATESARARARRMESYSDGDSPYKTKLSPMPASLNSLRRCGGGLVVSGSCTRQRESHGGGFKGIGGSMRFNRNVTDSGVENGRWLLNWNA